MKIEIHPSHNMEPHAKDERAVCFDCGNCVCHDDLHLLECGCAAENQPKKGTHKMDIENVARVLHETVEGEEPIEATEDTPLENFVTVSVSGTSDDVIKVLTAIAKLYDGIDPVTNGSIA